MAGAEDGATMALDHSPDAARGALSGLFGWARGTELIEVSIKSPRGKWHSQHWDVDTLLAQDTLKNLAWWSSQGREVYVGAVGMTQRPDKEWRRGGAALRGRAGALWLDVDCQAPGREGDDYFRTIGDAIEIVDACVGEELAAAALVIGSGWGVQYWIPLVEPVSGVDASRGVRALVGWVGELSVRQIDRVWDVTRVMRMPGTLNWRAGPDDEDARETGVIRWPEQRRRGEGRLSWENVIDAIGAQVTDVLGTGELAEHVGEDPLDWLLERYAPGSTETGDPGAGRIVGEVLGDLDRLAQDVLVWADVLEPAGWRCTSGQDPAGPGQHEQVWERPGKGDEMQHGERSAVVYADRPELLVVYSDSPSCGFASGLRGSGRRGTAAGVGVISKWRAWVDLRWAGDEREARQAVRLADASGSGRGVTERLAAAWQREMTWVLEWGREREWEVLREDAGRMSMSELEP